MMTNEQYLLGKLAEEAGELAQIAIKAQQFGIEEVFVIKDIRISNRERIKAEFNDVIGIINMLNIEEGIDIAQDDTAQTAKMNKTNKWRKYSKKLGLVELGAGDSHKTVVEKV